jgi:hypothetical protein
MTKRAPGQTTVTAQPRHHCHRATAPPLPHVTTTNNRLNTTLLPHNYPATAQPHGADLCVHVEKQMSERFVYLVTFAPASLFCTGSTVYPRVYHHLSQLRWRRQLLVGAHALMRLVNLRSSDKIGYTAGSAALPATSHVAYPYGTYPKGPRKYNK